MAYLYQQRVTRPLPKNATIADRRRRATKKELRLNPDQATVVERVATWRNKSGEKISGVVVGNRVRMTSGVWMVRYRDASGESQDVSTKCRDKSNAQSFLSELKKTQELITRGLLTETALDTADAAKSAVHEHLEAYLKALGNKRGKGRRERVSEKHLVNVRRSLFRIVAGCKFAALREINRETVSQWVTDRLQDAKQDWSARTINSHLEALKAFCSWCVSAKPQRLTANPMLQFPLLGEDAKRPRRALRIDEIERLLLVAKLRPVAEYGRAILRKSANEFPKDSKSRARWQREALTYQGIEVAFQRGQEALKRSPDKLAELLELGRERELLYLVLITTGLRQGELQSITIGQTYLDETPAWIELSHHDEKAGRGASIPLRDDIAERLRVHLAGRLAAFKAEIGVLSMKGGPAGLPMDQALFNVPNQLVRILDRDLEAAGIPKTDERGRTVDVHAMRHTFATMLSTSGVAPRVAQEAMRHSTMELTMKVYTDPKLLDVAGAMAAMPSLNAKPISQQLTVSATGTDGNSSVTSPVTLSSANECNKLLTNASIEGVFEMPKLDEKSPVSQGKTRLLKSRGERIRTSDPLVPNQMALPVSPMKTQGKNHSPKIVTATVTSFGDLNATVEDLATLMQTLSPDEWASVLAFAQAKLRQRGGK